MIIFVDIFPVVLRIENRMLEKVPEVFGRGDVSFSLLARTVPTFSSPLPLSASNLHTFLLRASQ
jgi:hypothetical protein